eukprot:4013885-Prymnesium_polylepis.1
MLNHAMLTRVEAIKAALGLPPSVVGAIPMVGAATLALGIEPSETAKLPARAPRTSVRNIMNMTRHASATRRADCTAHSSTHRAQHRCPYPPEEAKISV